MRRGFARFALSLASAGGFGAKITRRKVADDQHNGDAKYWSEQGEKGGESQSSNSFS